MIVPFLTEAFKLSAAFLYGSTGEIVIEKSGHLNLGIPGVMSVGGAVGCMTVYYLLKAKLYSTVLILLLPILTTLVAGGLMGLLYSFMTVTLRANQNVTGLALTSLGVGLAGYIMTKKGEATLIIGKTSKIFASLFQIQSDNWFVKIFLSHGLLFYIAIIIAIATQIILNRTRVGLHLRAVGENPATADAAGINVTGYRYGATIIGSAIAALGGLFTIMEYMGGNWEYILEGFGWLSVALVIFTVWRPALSILGSLIFGGLYISAAYINVSFAQTELLKTVPYVITILVLIITSIVGSKKAQPPASLGINYFREDR